MRNSRVETIVHPIRIRIIMTVFGRQLTTQKIAEALPDVPQASLYRHIGKLSEAGILQVVEEIPVRGAVEKVYALPEKAADLSGEDLSQISREDHLRYFTAYLMSLLSEYQVYLQQKTVDLRADGVAYNVTAAYFSEEEFMQFREEWRALLEKAEAYPATPERRRRLLANVVIPEKRDS